MFAGDKSAAREKSSDKHKKIKIKSKFVKVHAKKVIFIHRNNIQDANKSKKLSSSCLHNSDMFHQCNERNNPRNLKNYKKQSDTNIKNNESSDLNNLLENDAKQLSVNEIKRNNKMDERERMEFKQDETYLNDSQFKSDVIERKLYQMLFNNSLDNSLRRWCLAICMKALLQPSKSDKNVQTSSPSPFCDSYNPNDVKDFLNKFSYPDNVLCNFGGDGQTTTNSGIRNPFLYTVTNTELCVNAELEVPNATLTSKEIDHFCANKTVLSDLDMETNVIYKYENKNHNPFLDDCSDVSHELLIESPTEKCVKNYGNEVINEEANKYGANSSEKLVETRSDSESKKCVRCSKFIKCVTCTKLRGSVSDAY